MNVLNERISGPQLITVMIAVILATEILGAPGIAAHYAGPNAWLSIIVSSVVGGWSLVVMLALHKRYPTLFPIEYTQRIIGKIPGTIIGWYYIYTLLLYPITVTDETMSFITLFSNPRTPRLITISLFLIVCGAAVWYGIEAIGRCAQFIVPLNIILLSIVSLLLIKDMNWKYLRPFLAHGFGPVLQGAVVPSAWFGEFYIISFLLPLLSNRKKASNYGIIALCITVTLMVLVTIQSVTVDGSITGNLSYAYYTATRYVSIGDFLERIDPVIVTVWVFGGFIKNAFFIWIVVICIAQLLKCEDYRILLVPMMFLILICSLWTYPTAFDMTRFLWYTFPSLGLLQQNIIPTLLLLIDLIRHRQVKSK